MATVGRDYGRRTAGEDGRRIQQEKNVKGSCSSGGRWKGEERRMGGVKRKARRSRKGGGNKW